MHTFARGTFNFQDSWCEQWFEASFIKSFFRNVIVIRARARLSVLVRYCAAVFSKKKKPKEITNDTDSFVVVRNTHTFYKSRAQGLTERKS